MCARGAIILFMNFYVSDQADPLFRMDYIWASAHSSYYRINDKASTWKYARNACNAEGTALAVPESLSEVENLKILISNMRPHFSAIFIGIHDLFAQGDYVTIQGVPIVDTLLDIMWSEGKPDNENSTGSCVVMTRDGLLHSVPCEDKFPFLCKIKYKEIIRNKKCGNFDLGYKPYDNGKCYKLHVEPLTWHDAYLTCRAEQGNLAIINTEKEANLLTSFFGEILSSYAPDPNILLLGFSDLLYPFQYRTIFGETLPEAGYNAWSPLKEDPTHIYETRCGCVTRNGFLLATWCDQPSMFLCQRHISNETNIIT